MAFDGSGRFPQTRQSVLARVRSADEEIRTRAYDALIAAYWKPVYKYLRLKWRASPADAEDLTQEFFARAIAGRFFDPYDPAKARFRTFLRVCLDGFVANARKSDARLKRGGGVLLVPLEFETAEGELQRHDVAVNDDLDAYFHQEWIRSLVGIAIERLHGRSAAAGRERQYTLFHRYDIEGPDAVKKPTYRDLGRELGLSTTDVTNQLAAVRREFRTILLDTLREMCGSEDEFREEARQLLGIEPQ